MAGPPLGCDGLFVEIQKNSPFHPDFDFVFWKSPVRTVPIIICFVKNIIKDFLNLADISNVVVAFVNRVLFEIQMLYVVSVLLQRLNESFFLATNY